MSDKYILQATREPEGVLTFHLIPPMTGWKPRMYANMIADLVGHISTYTATTGCYVSEEWLLKTIQEELARREQLAASLDPLRKPT